MRTAVMICLSLASVAQAAELYTPWAGAGQRATLQNIDIAFKDHSGREGVLRDVIDRPVVVTFFYTRCQNMKKCSMALSRLGALQRQLAGAGLADDVRILAITYEPQFDTPERIRRFASDRGFRLGDYAMALQLDPERHQKLVDEIQPPANYNAGWINTHGVELSLLDAMGRVVRKYHTVLWDNEQVVKDLQRVLEEQ